MTVKVGVTLPSFVDDPEILIRVAMAAEQAELDGVFVYDHLWRGDPPNRRPALECFSMLGAVALADRLRPITALGASWIIVGPIDSSNPDNVPVLADVRARLLEE